MDEDFLIQKHNEILNYLLSYKDKNNDFTFSPRKQNNNNRLDKGFWFQGGDDYIFVPLYKRGCKHNKTKTIGFVYTENTQYIEIVFKRVENINDSELEFYNEIIEYLKKSDKIDNIEKKENKNQFFCYLEDRNLNNNLEFYIDIFRKKIDNLIEKYQLFSLYKIEEEELQKRLNRINEIKNNIGTMHREDNNTINNEYNILNSINTKNIILYGVPGVGKTHNYKRLVSLIEQGKSEKEIFDSICKNEITNEEYNSIFENIENDDRLEFVTFHQSYSYEDFIEGFRPQENGNIELEDGIFKKICKDAKINSLKASDEKTILFRDAINILLQEKIENEDLIKIDLKRDNSYFNIYDYNERTIFFEKQNGDRSHSLSLRTLEKMYNEEENNIIKGGLAPYYNPLLKELLNIKRTSTLEKEQQKNYYLIIDEINRGNISKIFGELITLVEENKRDKYEVRLPYSKDKFSIPSNLYIIATMNSSDKSIASIDIALRRRFTFLKMMPNVDLVENEKAKDLMIKLNDYIKENLGEDYLLGHSYFMKVQNDDDLDFIKEYKIKPLLEEYFFADNKSADEIIELAKKEYEEKE